VLAFVLPLVMLRRRKIWLAAMVLGVCVVGLSGCGTRSLGSELLASQSYTFTVTGTGTNLAGVVVTHSVVVTLVVE
jgi:hypothetical protein